MKKIRQISQNPIVIALVLFNFIFVSCNRDEFTKENSENPTKLGLNSKFSDKDVFKGIMFIEGPVADMFPEFKELNFRSFMKDETQVKNVLNFQDNLINNIATNNPNYLKNFRKNVSSGDYYVVQQAITDAAKLIQEKIIQISKNSKKSDKFINNIAHEFIQKNKITPNSSIKEIVQAAKENNKIKPGSTFWYDTDTFVYAVVAVAGAVVAVGAITVFLFAPESNGDNNSSSYITEKYISDITLGLKSKN